MSGNGLEAGMERMAGGRCGLDWVGRKRTSY